VSLKELTLCSREQKRAEGKKEQEEAEEIIKKLRRKHNE
jgi:hypothetical protein